MNSDIKYLKLSPQEAINMPFGESLKKLKIIVGENKYKQIFGDKEILSPVCDGKNSNWIKHSKIIGVNIRIVGTFWNVIKYLMTTPYDAVHFLPVFEVGCRGSIYSPINWKINSEYLDENLSEMGYKTPESQLKLIIKVIHAMGKTVGFDFVTHTDKFSEINFIYPKFFEWVKLNQDKTKELKYPDVIRNEIYLEVEEKIKDFLRKKGDFKGEKIDNDVIENFYTEKIPFDKRYEILFGKNEPLFERNQRRVQILKYIRNCNFELIPVTEYSPSRPVLFNKIVYDKDTDWAEFIVPNKYKESSVFNSLTPYKWYNVDNEGYPVKNSYIDEVWEYYIKNVVSIQEKFNLDFIRVDMGHNQLSHAHREENKDLTPREIWADIKDEIQKKCPYFALFGESFFTNCGYIDIFQDLRNKKFDIVLGAIHNRFLNLEMKNTLREYFDMKEPYKPCAVAISTDSDCIGLSHFYTSPLSNSVRYFISLFSSLPFYTTMGFEVRNNEVDPDFGYTGNYIEYCDKKYIWGENFEFLNTVQKLRDIYIEIYPDIKDLEAKYIEANEGAAFGFLYEKNNTPLYFFLVNLNMDFGVDVGFSDLPQNYKLKPIYSNIKDITKDDLIEINSNLNFENLNTGEVQIYKFEKIKKSKDTKNKNEILIVSTESYPFIKMGGMGDINHDLTKETIKHHPELNIKLMIPCFREKNGYSHSNLDDMELQKTGIKVKVQAGLIDTKAELYIAKKDNLEAYVVDFPELNTKNVDFDIIMGIFNNAAFNLLYKMKKLFNPKIVQTTDWSTCYLNYLIKSSKNNFYSDIKTLHTIHNAGVKYQGNLLPVVFLLCYSDRKTSKKILNYKNVKEHLNELILKNPEIKNEKNLFYMFLTKNDDFIIKNKQAINKLNSIIAGYLEKMNANSYQIQDENLLSSINMTKLAINLTDRFVTDSPAYFEEITTGLEYSSAKNLNYTFKKNKGKGEGILCGIDPKRYEPYDEDKIFFPFYKENYKEGKKKNKEFLQTVFYFGETSDVMPFISNPKFDFLTLGKLDINPDVPLIFCSSRCDTEQKGFVYLIEAIKSLIKENWNFQLILASNGIALEDSAYLQSFMNDISEKEEYKGKILLIDNFVPVYQYLASCDMLIFPSVYEPCGLVHFQAMRYGCVPIVSNTGGLKNSITSQDENFDTANGFKTDVDLKTSKNPEINIINALKEGIRTYYDNKEMFDKMIRNGLNYDSSYKKSQEKFYQLYKRLM